MLGTLFIQIKLNITQDVYIIIWKIWDVENYEKFSIINIIPMALKRNVNNK